MKSATVSVIGRPSSGKSTLVNTICGMKVSITSPTPQTTRNKIRGIYTDTRGQLVFTDTPGYHLSDKEINRRMQDVTVSALKDSDLILYLVDGKRRKGKEEEAIARMISLSKVPTVVAINKLDILSEEDKKEAEESVKAALPSSPVLFPGFPLMNQMPLSKATVHPPPVRTYRNMSLLPVPADLPAHHLFLITQMPKATSG